MEIGLSAYIFLREKSSFKKGLLKITFFSRKRGGKTSSGNAKNVRNKYLDFPS
ncbi:hypothetical protein [Enterococcus rivorum]|uniref:hypothetical protein n=1 Tax=Enterococcus rivorum TaxID=762845 RepID=UPI0036400139